MNEILLGQIGQVLGLLIAFSSIITLLFGKTAISKIRSWINGVYKAIMYPVNGTSRKLETLEEGHKVLSDKLDFIVSQLCPNSGTSIRDAINRLEKYQRISESKMAQYLDTKDAAIFETDEAGLYKWVSKSYEDLVDRPKSELLNWGWTVPIVPEDLESVRNEWALAIQQKNIFETSYRIRGKVLKCRAIPALFNNEVVAWTGRLMEDKNGG